LTTQGKKSAITTIGAKFFYDKGMDAIGIISALIAISAERIALWALCLISIGILIIFWVLDAFFLKMEKCYRFKYEWTIEARLKGNCEKLYDLNPYNTAMRKAFVDQIFMSYRKMDTEVAQKLMKRIHDLPNFEAVSIWYDRFLTAGEEFNSEILKAIENSTLFTMAVTPNITTKRDDGTNNFVVSHEYPHAKSTKCPIVPINATKVALCQGSKL